MGIENRALVLEANPAVVKAPAALVDPNWLLVLQKQSLFFDSANRINPNIQKHDYA